MSRPVISEQWSQIGASLVLTLIEQAEPDPTQPNGPGRREDVTQSIYALRHLAFRWGLDWPALMAEVEERFDHMMSQEEP